MYVYMTVKTEQLLQNGGASEYVYHDRTAWLCVVFVGKRYGSKGYPLRNPAHLRWTLSVNSSSPVSCAEFLGKADKYQRWTSSRSDYVPTATTGILSRRFPRTCETVGQVFKFVWRLRWKVLVICVSLSTFVSFQSRLVPYLLTFPRTSTVCKNQISEFFKRLVATNLQHAQCVCDSPLPYLK